MSGELSVVGQVAGDSAESLAAWAYQRLMADIQNGRIEPGATLSIPALARSLGLSRSPVREAVQRLIHEGLATHAAGRGARLKQLDIDEMAEIYQIKAVLDGLASRLATPLITLAAVHRLRDMVDEQRRELSATADPTVLMRMDVDFHSYIRSFANTPVLVETVDQFTSRSNIAFPSGWSEPENARLSVEEHHAMVEAVASGDADAAEAATARHALCVRTRLVRWHRALAERSGSTRGARSRAGEPAGGSKRPGPHHPSPS